MLVKFENVGRNKVSWEVEIPELDEIALLKSVRKNATIMSKALDIDYDSETNEGGVYAGGFRQIGSFSVVLDEAQRGEGEAADG